MRSLFVIAARVLTSLALVAANAALGQSAPGITTQPASQTVLGGSNAVFLVVATGQTPLTYQWSKGGVNLADGTHISGATSSALTVIATTNADAGSYRVVVTNRHGSITSSSATLTVLVPPTISAIPNQRTFPNTVTRAIPFTIGNAQSPTITVTSSDTTLVPPGNITLSGAGTNWSITLMPAGALTGTVTITVGVTNSTGIGASKSFSLSVTDFSEVAANLAGVSRGTVNWVDYDNDGRLDLFVSGMDTNYSPHTWLYHNNGDGTFSEVATPFANLMSSSADWGDFNNDGLPDLALNGGNSSFATTIIYRNDGNGNFTQITNIGAFNPGCVRWGDYDNDGRVDLLITEANFTSVWHNNGDGTFSFQSTSMLGAGNNASAWVDFDGDGALDVFITGEASTDYYGSKLYRNQGSGVFTNSGNVIPGFFAGGIAWGDFNNDGAPDVVLTGELNGNASVQIYRNDAGALTNVAGSLPGLQRSAAAAVGDFNNDGKLDLFLAGYDSGFNRVSQMFRGFGDMTFTGSQFAVPGMVNGYAAWGDYDNDGALDLVTIGEIAGDVPTIKLYHNNGAMPDTPPTLPSGLTVTLGYNSALLTWTAAADAEQSGGLTYNARIGTNANGINILSPVSDLNTGFRRVPKIGNAGYRTSLLITNLVGGTYYWSVQAIDNSFVGSTFATEQSFTLPAPVITNQPTNLTVSAGFAASFSVGATGAPPLAYQWQFNGTNIVGATESVFTIPSAALSDQGTYLVIVTNQFGVAASSNVVLNVLAPPSLTQQPQSITNEVGTWPTFSVSAAGTPPLTYQWFFNGAPLANGRAFGVNSNVLTIASALMTDAGSYWVVVSNNYGTATSDVATLAVTAPDVLINVDFGSGHSLKTGPAAIGQTASDFWNSYGTNITGVTNLLLADGTPSAVTVNVYGAGPVAPVNSNPDPMYHDYLYQYNLPGNLTVDTTNLPPGVFDFYYYAGCGDYNYQLYVNGVSQGQQQVWGSGDSSTNWQQGVHYVVFRGVTLTNFTSSVRVVITYLDSVCLEAVISGMQISEASTAPLFVLQPTNTAVLSGFDATFTAGAIGSPQPISYQWLFNGTPLTNNAHISGANTYSLTILSAQTNDIGSYQVLASAGSNTVSSAVVQFFAQSVPPTFLYGPIGGVAPPGSTVTLFVRTYGSIPIGYQWFANGAALVDDGRIAGSTSPTLTIAPAQTNDSGIYYVIASNSVNVTISSVVNVFVGVPPVISQQPLNQTTIVGSNANFGVSVDGTAPLSFVWQHNGSAMTDGSRIFGSATASLSISNAQTSDAGTYSLIVSNGAGAATSTSAMLTVLAPPTISPQPTGRSLPLGLPTTFTGNATGTGPITFQWQLNGTNISGATTTAYTISNISLADIGTYNLVASNLAGITVSTNALLTIGPVACWGRNTGGQCLPPAGLSNVVGIAGAANYSASVQSDGSLRAWGLNFKLPAVSNAVAVSASSEDQGHALLADGTIVGWGRVAVPAGISNVVAVADGGTSTLYLRDDGTVGAIPSGYAPVGLTKIAAIAAGVNNQNLALRSDGTVLEWGALLTMAGTTAITNPVAGLSNVVAIAAGYWQCLALKSDGRIVTWGTGAGTNIPAILTNASAPRVVAIAAGGYPQGQAHSLAVLTNGTVISWGDNLSGETNVPSGLSNVIAVAAGAYHSLGLVSDGRPLIVQSPVGGTAFSGRDFAFNAQVVGNAPLAYQWNFNGTNITGATNATLTVTNIQFANAGTYQLLVSNSVGSASSLPLPVNVINSAPFLTIQPTNQIAYVGTRFVWSVPVNGSGPMKLQWRIGTNTPPGPLAWQNLPGATNEDLVFDPLRVSDMGTYSLVASNTFGAVTSSIVALTVRQVVAWGDNSLGQTNVPASLTNAIAVTSIGYENLALRDDGTVALWGNAGTNVPAGLSNLVEVADGYQGSRIGLRMDGTTVPWGSSLLFSNALAGLYNVVAMEMDTSGGAFLHYDGTVTRIGITGVVSSPAGFSNIVALAHDANGFIALRADGTVLTFQGVTQPPVTTNVLAATAGMYAGVFLRRDSTIVDWPAPTNSLTNIIEVAATDNVNKLAVRADGTVVTWTGNTVGLNPPAGLGGVIAADAGFTHFVTLLSPRPFPPVFLPNALDTGALVVSSRSSAQWYGQTQITHDGRHAARSAAIARNTGSSMRTLVTNGPITVSFWWKVSSETNHDFLSFSIGGVPQAAISGEVDWQQFTFTVPAGPQMLVWTYSKDANGTVGMDAGFVDQLTFTAIAPTITSQPLSQTVLGGPAVTFNVGVSGTPPLTYRWLNRLGGVPTSISPTFTINPSYRSSSGTYYVIVTNSVGSVTSSNAVLTVHVPQTIGLPLLQPDGTFSITSMDADQSAFGSKSDLSGFRPQYSSNLVDWWPVRSPLSISNGVLQFNDPDATNAPQRFYRILEDW